MPRHDAHPRGQAPPRPWAIHRGRVLEGDDDELVLPGDPPVRVHRDGLGWVAERNGSVVPVHDGDALVADGHTWTLHLPDGR